jgi:PKD repeat protein
MKKSVFYRIPVAVVFCLYALSIQAQYDYEDALATSILFFDANKCGPDAGDNNVYPWRGACHVSDGGSINLTGGFHDAGDHVKFGLPQTWTAATLGFALYEFREAFDNSGATPEMLSTLKYFTDYFIRSHVSANTFYYNVGDGNADHGYWGPPENQTGSRPLIAASPSTPASDVCGEAAAALALMYLNYQNVDANYANQCLTHAIQIYNLGRNNLGRSSDGGGGNFYKSSSHFDDLSWAAIWLSIATGNNSYLDPVYDWVEVENDYGDDPYNKHWAPAWDDVTVYVLLKLYQLTGVQKYYDGVINNLEWYRDDCQRTPYGLPWLDSWGVLRYASSEAGVGYLAAKHFDYAGYLETANLTMNYCLGSNPRNSSYLTGWGNNPPVHPHHRANEPNRDGNTNGIIGALVGGPGNGDNYQDNVNDYTMNEVAIDYNASFILGLAGRIYFQYHEPPRPNVPPVVTLTSPTSGGSYQQGQTITLSANASDSDGTVQKVEFLVGGTKVGEDLSAPYSINWTIALAGSYSISARAIDNKLGSTVSNSVSITATSNLPDPTTPNLALGKPASASSLENSGLPAGNAVDGSYGSRWSSEFSDPQWLRVDLQAVYTINRVILTWETAAGSAYEIQVSSNGSQWTTVATIGGGNGGEDDIVFSAVDARYVRMYGTARTTPYGYSLFEAEVYGTEGDVNTPPNAVASGAPLSGDYPLNVQFSAAGSNDPDGTIAGYAWTFGDGTSGSGQSVSHVYSGAGSYQAVLTVTDNEGATDQASVNINVTDPAQQNNPPVAVASATPTSGTAPVTISFNGSGSSDPDNDPLTYSWNFGDGTGGTGISVSHTYNAEGSYSAVLTVSDGSLSAQATVTIQVDGGTTTEPCDSPTTVSIPFTKDGAGEFCYVTSTAIAYINSWNMNSVEINGVDYTDTWSNNLPAAINGQWYIYYNGSYPWSHFEAPAAKSANTGFTSAKEGIGIYPNPFQDGFTIDVSAIDEVKRIEVLNSLGQVIQVLDDSQLRSELIAIQFDQPVGFYLLRVSTETEVIVKSIIKE